MNPTEAVLLAAFLLDAPRALPNVRFFRRNVAMVRGANRSFRVALPGQADVYGLVRGGMHLELEFKAASGRLSDDQARWRDFCATWDVPYLLLQAVDGESVEQTLSRWIDLVREIVERRSPS